MLGSNYEKMALISPAAAKDWPQTQLSDDLKVSMSNNMDNNSSRNSAMVAMNQKLAQQDPQQLQQQQQQQALKCPRCDSSNTKFCYYNNYSLTQPRHFCKACKRYWTRGGTLRNVPVGGGCRKNKRVKRPNINSSSNNNSSSSASLDAPPSSTTPASSTIHHPLLGHHNLNPSSESYLNNNHHLFYGHNNPDSEVNLLYQSRFGAAGNNPSSRVVFSGLENTASGYDLIPGLGLGFSPGNNIIDVNANPSKDMEMHGIVNPSSNSFLSSCYSSLIGPGGGMFSPPSSNCTTATTMSSLISSYGLQKFNSNGSIATDKSQQGGARVGGSGGGSNQFQTFFPFEEMQMSSSSHGFGSNEQNKDVKVEEDGQNRLGGGWKNEVAVPCQNHHMEQSDPTSYWNNNNNAAAAHAGSSWPDLANIGSSVTSLI